MPSQLRRHSSKKMVQNSSSGQTTDQRVGWLRRMVEIRAFEQKVQELFLQGVIPGTTHLCQGQEAVSVGVVSAMRPGDYATVTYRGHGQALALGVPIRSAFAELMGRSTGLCRGLGGSMHFADRDRGLLGAFAIVGAGLPVALGAAMSAKFQGSGRVAVTFFGDGATNIGTFHESLNMAAVWKAPIVFVCENNLYGEYSPIGLTTSVNDLASRAGSYGMQSEIVDGMDVAAVNVAAARAVERARAGHGPTLLEMKTYRFSGHSRSDPAKYRPAGELETWKGRDPIKLLNEWLQHQGATTPRAFAQMEQEVQHAVDEAAATAQSDPYPDLEEVYRNVVAS